VFNVPSTPVESIRLPLSRLPTLDLFEEVLHAPARTNPLVELCSERSGWTLTFDSNRAFLEVDDYRLLTSFAEPGVQFYSGRLFDGKGTRKPIHGWSGRDGDGYQPHSTFLRSLHTCLTLQHSIRFP
jgi:aldose 1-epimerase